MIEYKSGEELSFMKKSPHSPECVSSILKQPDFLVVFFITLKKAFKLCMIMGINEGVIVS